MLLEAVSWWVLDASSGVVLYSVAFAYSSRGSVSGTPRSVTPRSGTPRTPRTPPTTSPRLRSRESFEAYRKNIKPGLTEAH